MAKLRLLKTGHGDLCLAEWDKDRPETVTLAESAFAEHFTADGAVLAVAAIGFAVMCGGVVVLTQTAPATMKADIPDDRNGDTQHDATGGRHRRATQ